MVPEETSLPIEVFAYIGWSHFGAHSCAIEQQTMFSIKHKIVTFENMFKERGGGDLLEGKCLDLLSQTFFTGFNTLIMRDICVQ
jgi:hypothetical protein